MHAYSCVYSQGVCVCTRRRADGGYFWARSWAWAWHDTWGGGCFLSFFPSFQPSIDSRSRRESKRKVIATTGKGAMLRFCCYGAKKNTHPSFLLGRDRSSETRAVLSSSSHFGYKRGKGRCLAVALVDADGGFLFEFKEPILEKMRKTCC